MQVQIVEGPLRMEPIRHRPNTVAQVKLTVELSPMPDEEWISTFYSDEMAREFYSVRPRDFTINGPQCNYQCHKGKHERIIRVLRRIIERTNERSGSPAAGR